MHDIFEMIEYPVYYTIFLKCLYLQYFLYFIWISFVSILKQNPKKSSLSFLFWLENLKNKTEDVWSKENKWFTLISERVYFAKLFFCCCCIEGRKTFREENFITIEKSQIFEKIKNLFRCQKKLKRENKLKFEGWRLENFDFEFFVHFFHQEITFLLAQKIDIFHLRFLWIQKYPFQIIHDFNWFLQTRNPSLDVSETVLEIPNFFSDTLVQEKHCSELKKNLKIFIPFFQLLHSQNWIYKKEEY